MVLSKSLTGLRFADQNIDQHWQRKPLQRRIVKIKIFGRGARKSLVDLYSCFGAKNLKSVLENSFWEKCLGPQWCL